LKTREDLTEVLGNKLYEWTDLDDLFGSIFNVKEEFEYRKLFIMNLAWIINQSDQSE